MISLIPQLRLITVCSTCRSGGGEKCPDHTMPRDAVTGQIDPRACFLLDLCPVCGEVVTGLSKDTKKQSKMLTRMRIDALKGKKED